MYRIVENNPEVFIVHPGGPYWEKKDEGAWSIPKGEFETGEDSLEAARREFEEETGSAVAGDFVELTSLKQPSGKIIYAWAVEGNIDAALIKSNMFPMEWPPRSGREQEFPEVDKGGWFNLAEAREKLLPGQRAFLEELQNKLSLQAEDCSCNRG